MEINETITKLAKKGFLLDRDSLDFFNKLDDFTLTEEVLNKITLLNHSRIITKKILQDFYEHIKHFFIGLQGDKKEIADCFFRDICIVKINAFSDKKEIAEPISSDLKIISSNIIPYKRI